MFQEDQQVSVKRLLSLWIAEGFIRKVEMKRLSDVAGEYLNDLIGRSLLMVAKQTSMGRVKRCRIHDMLHEFCSQKTKEEQFYKRLFLEGGDDFSGDFKILFTILRNGCLKTISQEVKNGIVNTFNNMPDDSFVIDHKLLYNDLVGLICERVGWNRKNVNLSLSILYDTMRNGFRRIAKIKDDASLQVLYFLPSSTYIDLYVDLEVAGISRSHLEVGTSSGRPNVENVDYMEDDDVGGPFMEDGDHMEYNHGEDDEDYTSISDQSDENQSISEGSRESDEEGRIFKI
ncbi:OLC1v1013484C1 [Oldenlandia corymbosa var. corymbosa]|uniref:OLC1v1013484C1 n=1 Tax=Oldenlandia corymbosa var. corymbosa TaxID=529605 RepID=A0AAV1DZ70_OLDCO|nr:OLC1v1013484C1 [Oldenlandia corymbosa var. corymbosa]